MNMIKNRYKMTVNIMTKNEDNNKAVYISRKKEMHNEKFN